MPKKANKSTTTTSAKQPTTTAKQPTMSEMRLPDLVLRQIFSYLKFVNIKACRLVCKQWHRHALDNVNFALVVEHQRQFPVQPRSQAANDRFNALLVPFPAIRQRPLAERVQVNAVQRPDHKAIDFYRLRNDIREAFGQKIRQVWLELADCTAEQIHALIQACWEDYKAADFVDGERTDIQLNFSYEREWKRNGKSALKLRELYCPLPNRLADKEAGSIIVPFFCQAANIRTLHSCEMQPFEKMLNDYERICNHGRPLSFPECKQLVVQWSNGTFAPFNKISTSFNNVAELSLLIFNGVRQVDADFAARLQQLVNLKVLNIIQPSNNAPLLRLPALCLPNLVRLRLAGPQLSANPLHFESTSLQELCVQGDFNIVPLAVYARSGLKKLTKLELHAVTATTVDRFLPEILKGAKGLQELTVQGAGFELATAACVRAAEANLQKLRRVEVGAVSIPWEVRRIQFVRELVAWHTTIGLSVPLLIDCNVQPLLASLIHMARQKGQINVDGTNVMLSAPPGAWTVEMAWRNNFNGTPQKLGIRFHF